MPAKTRSPRNAAVRLCAGMATARCFDLIGTRSKAASGGRLETKWFQPIRQHIRHKHLPEWDYACEKNFLQLEQPMMPEGSSSLSVRASLR
jgi:hypothetical protein